ncbi:HAD family hydrolase [Halalkalirubrum salinum]|uniref:HAD family hydrolase n=1 Tax=Halalkalirubrum salinum TaxID=2563889 RepID=UPI0010FADF8C|nr:HAD family hydrolase [Halalkalirubrum salinum]
MSALDPIFDDVDAVLFDLDGTLVQYRRSPAALLSIAFHTVGIKPLFDVDAYQDRFDSMLEETVSIDELRARCFADLAAAAGFERTIGRKVARAFADERDHTNVDRCPGVGPLFDAINASGRTTAIVTNGPPAAQRQKLLGSEIDADTVVYAGTDTAAKPDPEPFRSVCSTLDVALDRTVHIGDSFRSDVRGAHAAGIRSIFVGDPHAIPEAGPTPSRTVQSLKELVSTT